MVFAGLLVGLGRQYLVSASRTFAAINATAGGTLGNFNLAQMDPKNSIEVTNLLALEAQLKEFGPKAFNKFKKDARKIGEPARKEVRDAFQRVGPWGPLGMPKRPNRYYDGFNTVNGRLSWAKAATVIGTAKGIDVNYKSRNLTKAMYNLQTGKDGNLSVIRIRVRQAALVMADMAGRGRKSMYSEGRGITRPYQIDLFGRGIVTRRHRINRQNSEKFIENMNSKNKKGSRFAYPALEEHTPQYTKNVETLLNQTIAEINRTLGR